MKPLTLAQLAVALAQSSVEVIVIDERTPVPPFDFSPQITNLKRKSKGEKKRAAAARRQKGWV